MGNSADGVPPGALMLRRRSRKVREIEAEHRRSIVDLLRSLYDQGLIQQEIAHRLSGPKRPISAREISYWMQRCGIRTTRTREEIPA